MKTRLIAAVVVFLTLAGAASAHRLDEYLQATLISVEKDRVEASMRLVPGIAVSAAILATIDTDADGVISPAEQTAYARRVLGDLALTVDGRPLTLKLGAVQFPEIEQIRQGLGEIHIDFSAALPAGGTNRRLILVNHHLNKNAAYLVNSLAPDDPGIQIVAQTRNNEQSIYRLDFTQSGAGVARPGWVSSLREWTQAAGMGSMFRLGVRHIAEGTDHLLFLLVLLLPAPLLAVAGRWGAAATVRGSLLRILQIVTAFTLGHSITLALGAWGVIRVPSRPIEVLIAVSILVSAIHALRPIFPGKEAAIAAFFGLIHGLAFASTLSQLGLGRWERVGGILAFNLGIETMQLAVVAATLPSLLLLSRTRAYPWFRIGGAAFAGTASLGWIVERIFDVHTPVDAVVNAIAHQAAWIAAALFLFSLACAYPAAEKQGATEIEGITTG